MTDFVLLHGTAQSAQGWDRLVTALEHCGHHAHTPTIHDDLDVDGHIASLVAQLPPALAGPIVAPTPAAACSFRPRHRP